MENPTMNEDVSPIKNWWHCHLSFQGGAQQKSSPRPWTLRLFAKNWWIYPQIDQKFAKKWITLSCGGSKKKTLWYAQATFVSALVFSKEWLFFQGFLLIHHSLTLMPTFCVNHPISLTGEIDIDASREKNMSREFTDSGESQYFKGMLYLHGG